MRPSSANETPVTWCSKRVTSSSAGADEVLMRAGGNARSRASAHLGPEPGLESRLARGALRQDRCRTCQARAGADRGAPATALTDPQGCGERPASFVRANAVD